jgi:hypothetical protein
MDCRCPAVSTFALTPLALVVIALQYLPAFALPFLALVELLYLASIDKLYNFFGCHINSKKDFAPVRPAGALLNTKRDLYIFYFGREGPRFYYQIVLSH